MDLYKAHHQWATRPEDERFWTIEELYEQTRGYAQSAKETLVPAKQLSVGVQGGDVVLETRGQQAKFTHWSFGQICQRAQAPASYLRTLPPYAVSQCLNHGLRTAVVGYDEPPQVNVLTHDNGNTVCRAFTSQRYSRIWNYEIAERLVGIEDAGWQVPPAIPVHSGKQRPATEEDVLRLRANGWGIEPGQPIGPAGIYASDHDMFVFLVNESVRIDDGSEHGLGRGLFIRNSEVGGGAFEVMRFLYAFICGNHIVWGAQDVESLRIVHTGSAADRFTKGMLAEFVRYSNESSSLEEGKILEAKRQILGANKDEVLDAIFGRKDLALPRKVLDASYDLAVKQADLHGSDVSPRSVWGMVQGITAFARTTPFGDERHRLDKAAGLLLSQGA